MWTRRVHPLHKVGRLHLGHVKRRVGVGHIQRHISTLRTTAERLFPDLTLRTSVSFWRRRQSRKDRVLTFDYRNCSLQSGRSGMPWTVGNVQRISAIRAPAIDQKRVPTGVRFRAASTPRFLIGLRAVPKQRRVVVVSGQLTQVISPQQAGSRCQVL